MRIRQPVVGSTGSSDRRQRAVAASRLRSTAGAPMCGRRRPFEGEPATASIIPRGSGAKMILSYVNTGRRPASG